MRNTLTIVNWSLLLSQAMDQWLGCKIMWLQILQTFCNFGYFLVTSCSETQPEGFQLSEQNKVLFKWNFHRFDNIILLVVIKISNIQLNYLRSQAWAVYPVLHINLLNCKFFGSTRAPAFETFTQSKFTVKPGNSPLWLVEILESRWLSILLKNYNLAD